MNSRQRLLLLVLVALLVVGALGAYAVRARGSGPGVAQDRPGPVVLVPGYGGGTGALEELAARLEQEGRRTVLVRLPGDGTGDLREQAEVLDSTVDGLLERGAPSVDVVGFSAGGVVARLWVDERDGADDARRVVTLGSPHHGTDVARLASVVSPGRCPPACRQLSPQSSLLQDLNAGDETPDGPRWVSVWTAVDEVVTPPESSRLEGALDVRLQSVCPGAQTEHGALPRDPAVQAIVVRALAVEPLDSLDGVGCG